MAIELAAPREIADTDADMIETTRRLGMIRTVYAHRRHDTVQVTALRGDSIVRVRDGT